MLEWFNNLSDANKIAIVIPVGLAVIAGLFAWFKWLSGRIDGSGPQQETIHQEGGDHTAIVTDTIKGTTNITGGESYGDGDD